MSNYRDVYRVTYRHLGGETESQWARSRNDAGLLQAKLRLAGEYGDIEAHKVGVPMHSLDELVDWLNEHAYKGL